MERISWFQVETNKEKSGKNYQGCSLCLGLILSNHLVAAGFTSFSVLAAANPRDIEIACSKTPPFGNSVRNFALNMPRYRSTVKYTIYIYIIFTLQYTYTYSLLQYMQFSYTCTLYTIQFSNPFLNVQSLL